MLVYRLSREKFALPLSGHGAALRGARWNSMGTELIYTAANRSLAMAEVVVHLSLASLPEDFVMIEINIPDSVGLIEIQKDHLPEDWNTFPHSSYTQKIGDELVFKNQYCLLKVPSAVTQGDFNILINPRHPEFQSIKVTAIAKFPFDRRLFKS